MYKKGTTGKPFNHFTWEQIEVGNNKMLLGLFMFTQQNKLISQERFQDSDVQIKTKVFLYVTQKIWQMSSTISQYLKFSKLFDIGMTNIIIIDVFSKNNILSYTIILDRCTMLI